MKIVLLAGASSIHTVRWANGLNSLDHKVYVISQHHNVDPFDSGVTVHLLPQRGVLGYFIMVPAVRRLLCEINPDIVNAHYASGYATTARLVDYHPWLLSVWGSDVYDFPNRTALHAWLVRKNLYAADQVASTSHCMADEVRRLAPKLNEISITPFGVDLSVYYGLAAVQPVQRAKLVIGTVKTMKMTYGIDILIEAYALLLQKLKHNTRLNIPQLELRLVGGGDQILELKKLATKLNVGNSVSFIGQVPHSEVPKELIKLDIYVALSRSESFGVAIIEAGAAGRPVIVSDVGGLPEVTLQNKTGLIVARENPEAAAEALEKLVLNAELRHQFGVEGQKHVSESYSWESCVKLMLKVYEKTINKIRKS